MTNILNKTGFVKCDFGPEEGEHCDKCHKDNKQLYYLRTDYWENEGIYYCKECVKIYANELDRIVKIVCPNCKEEYDGWEGEEGICFDCYATTYKE